MDVKSGESEKPRPLATVGPGLPVRAPSARRAWRLWQIGIHAAALVSVALTR